MATPRTSPPGAVRGDLSRRAVLLGGAGIAGAYVLGACSSDEPAAPPTTGTGGPSTTGVDGTTTTPLDPDALVLGESFDRNNLLVAGLPQRAPFLLFQASGGLVPIDEAPAELTFSITSEAGQALDDITVALAGVDVERAYYPLLTTFPDTGIWNITTTAAGQALATSVGVNESATVPQVGDPIPTAPTPTTADPLGVTTLCTREPACPFHEVSLDDVVAAGRPVAVIVSTPAYCQVAICGPVLDLLVDTAPAIDVVHVEVYPNDPPPDGLPTTLVTDTFGLAYEPVLFVADATGAVVARLDNIYDGPELTAALALV
jgi:hypothetical protein